MGRSKRTNALVEMNCQLLAIGVSISADATMFTNDELAEMVRAAARSEFLCKVKIRKSRILNSNEKASIIREISDSTRVVFL
jgi:hypothetical protein